MSNGREIGAGDTMSAILQPIAIARGDGLVLDRFEGLLRALDPSSGEPGRFPPYYVAFHGRHLVTRYPVAPMIVTLPLVLPQIALLDVVRPGWDDDPNGTFRYARWMAKNASAALMALLAIVLLEMLRRLGLGRVGLAATVVAALGSPLWMIAAESPWQHGPTALALTVAILLLLQEPRPAFLLGAGLALGVMVASRHAAIVFALPLLASVVLRRPHDARWLLPPAAAIGVLVLAYNLVHFGAIFGGQSELEAIRLRLQGLPRVWGNLAVGTVGTLLSPNRGLLVFCPWVAATALVLAAARARPTATPLVAPLLVGLAAHLVVVAGYSAWWAGWCFGPRYWTEAIPVLAIPYAMALDRATRTQTVLLVAGGVVAIAIHAVGSVCYPSSWNATPAPVGVRHERVWDWRDTELGRELREGPRPRDFPIGVP